MLGWARPGDRIQEFEETALVHLDTLYRSALRLTHNRAEVEDLVQETCLRDLPAGLSGLSPLQPRHQLPRLAPDHPQERVPEASEEMGARGARRRARRSPERGHEHHRRRA